MRENLKEARRVAGMTQKKVAEYLGITEATYHKIEHGSIIGKVLMWDMLEDLFNIPQRVLREDL